MAEKVKETNEPLATSQEVNEADGDKEMSNNVEYFKSYMDISVHELMLKDTPRTLAYKEAFEKSTDLFHAKTVLDVGAGTGILSLFAAQCGAKKVFAVEASDMAVYCQEIIKANGMESIITVIHSPIEETDLPVKNVDIIISEWMGFYLLHESMLDSVLYARDKWLSPEGWMFPSHAKIYACPVNMDQYCQEKFAFWGNVYGFDFSALIPSAMHKTLQQPVITHLKPDQCLAKPQILAEFNLKKATLNDIQSLNTKFAFHLEKESTVHGFAAWFDVDFSPVETDSQPCDVKEDLSQTLSTSPFCEETHWKQTVCFLPVSVCGKQGETIYCKVELTQSESNKRQYDISLQMLETLLDTDDSDDNYDDEEGEEFEDFSNHPMPCDCGSGRCRIISALIEKYDTEQAELEMEAEFVDVTAEVQAAEALDSEVLGTDSDILGTDSSYLDDET